MAHLYLDGRRHTLVSMGLSLVVTVNQIPEVKEGLLRSSKNLHSSGNDIYMDDCWGIIVKLDSWNSIPLFACLLTLPSPSQCIRLK